MTLAEEIVLLDVATDHGQALVLRLPQMARSLLPAAAVARPARKKCPGDGPGNPACRGQLGCARQEERETALREKFSTPPSDGPASWWAFWRRP